MDIVTKIEDLSVRSDEIDLRKENDLVRKTILSLKESVREHNLKGLSAIQIGVDKRILVVNFNGDIRSFINPIITSAKGIELSRETCSSLPGRTFIRPRNNNITVTYQTPLGKVESRQFVGLAAVVFQHELDHLDGLLLSDIGLEIDDDFDTASEEERTGVINAYLDSLDLKQKEIQQEISSDKDLKQMSDAIDFIESVQRGETELKATPFTEEQKIKAEEIRKSFEK